MAPTPCDSLKCLGPLEQQSHGRGSVEGVKRFLDERDDFRAEVPVNGCR